MVYLFALPVNASSPTSMKHRSLLLLLISCSTNAWGAFLYHDSASTNGGEFSSDYPIENLKNGGYSSAADTENASIRAGTRSYATTSPPAGGYPVTITFEFDVAVSLDAFHLWNHSNGASAAANQGVNAFTLTFYDGPNGTGSQIGSPYSNNAAKAPASGLYPAETFNFGTSYKGVRSVTLTADNHNPGSLFVGIREAAFEGSQSFLYHSSASTDGGVFVSGNGPFPLEDLKNANHSSPQDLEDAALAGESYATTDPPLGGFPVNIMLEFDSPAILEAFHLWNHTNGNAVAAPGNGVGDFSLTFYDGPGGTGNQIGSPFNGSASAAPATGSSPAQTFGFGAGYEGVRSVLFQITDKANNTTEGFVAMREIGFGGSTVLVPPANPDRVVVYLVGGQSNADGYGVTSELSGGLELIQSDIDLFHGNGGGNSMLPANQLIRLQPGSGSMTGNAGGFGPELSFGVDIHDALGSERARIAIIKHTLGGTSLHSNWFPGGDGTTAGDGSIYQNFQTTVSSGLAALASVYPGAAIEIEGMIWHQGEADAGSSTNAGNYQTNLTNFIADVRSTYDSDLKFGIVQLSDNQTALDPVNRATVKAAQAAVANSDVLSYLVETDDQSMGGSSSIHFGTSGNLAIGSRLATGMQQVAIKDVEENGLDDDWEELYWGIGNTGQDPAGDDDKDGLSNLEEFLWLTNPLVSNVVVSQLQTSPVTTLTWPSSPDRRYLIEVSSDMQGWTRLDSFIPAGIGPSTSYLLPEDPVETRRFFRVGVHR
ncbi:sialate O-acetylesterase [Haloferula rosea]|uniref:Sialate O-acetylesterase domain-containing protein n=1 Tax=Haloferula rosea TaxID=490093 RepID=A0A934RBY1_9BACT|nr:sialate O-acetylesterase [Haloferula rosea]MBK1825801.1 hypothetical protein [Haloferula rosea]